MNNKIKKAYNYLRKINHEGNNIKLNKKLNKSIVLLNAYVYRNETYKLVSDFDKLGEIGMGFDYFYGMVSDDNNWTVTVDTTKAIEDILYGVYLSWFFSVFSHEKPINIETFIDLGYDFKKILKYRKRTIF